MGKHAFGELKLHILSVMKDTPMSVHDVHAALGASRSYTTIMTVMSRMAKSGELLREKIGKQYFYIKNPNQKAFPLIKRLVGLKKPSQLVSYLLDLDEEFTPEELIQIEKQIQEKRHGR